MEIHFKTNKLKKIFESKKEIEKKYGIAQAKKITQRMGEIKSAETLNDIYVIPSTRLHYYSGTDKNIISIDLIHPFRLILEQLDGTKGDYKSITKINIIEVIDPH